MSRNRLYLLVLGLAIAGYGLIIYNVSRSGLQTRPLQTLCIFKLTTGIPCPACGTTRSVSSLVVGKFDQAFMTNPLGFLLGGMLIIFPLLILFDFILKTDNFYHFYFKIEQLFKIRWVTITAILLIVVNWVWNIYKKV